MVSKVLAVSVIVSSIALAAAARAEPEGSARTVSELLTGGWQIAGFTNTFDNRSALMRFRHPSETFLVQCRTGLDVTRTPPVYANCYELR